MIFPRMHFRRLEPSSHGSLQAVDAARAVPMAVVLGYGAGAAQARLIPSSALEHHEPGQGENRALLQRGGPCPASVLRAAACNIRM
jgi:hypothetical protein